MINKQERIGSINYNIWGEKGEVIDTKPGGKVVVKTEYGKIVTVRWKLFLEGKFDCYQTISRIGQKRTNNKGVVGICIKYYNSSKIDVKLDNGQIITTNWENFNKGYFREKYQEIRIGERIQNYQGSWMEIINYKSAKNIDVRFDTGYVSKNKTYQKFLEGDIKDLLYPYVCNVGYFGIGNHTVEEKINGFRIYATWNSIFTRCYQSNENKDSTYTNCEVCPIWHNYQNFADWIYENIYNIPYGKLVIDKDLLIKNNKTYGPDTCCLLPNEINICLARTSHSVRGDYPIGVQKKNKQRW